MTVNDIFEKAMSLMDERTETGIVDADATLIYKKNSPYILTILQNELLLIGDVYSTHEISRKSIQPIVGVLSVKEHDTDDETEISSTLGKAYYFEIDNPCTVYIEDYTTTWNTLVTITDTTATDFTAYKGVLTNTPGATKTRIRFSGDYYYNYRNVAIYDKTFEEESKVPNYGEYVKYSMPSDFSSISQIIDEDTDYEQLTDYHWEGKGDLYVPYSYTGNIKIVYRPVPSALSDADSVMQIDDVICNSILPYGLAREILATENAALSNYFGQRYDELKYTIRKPRPKSISKRTDINNVSLTF